MITADAADKLTAPHLIELAHQKSHQLVEALGTSLGDEKLKKVKARILSGPLSRKRGRRFTSTIAPLGR
jgi:hypothetical protein